jgi:hypothetical protein
MFLIVQNLKINHTANGTLETYPHVASILKIAEYFYSCLKSRGAKLFR